MLMVGFIFYLLLGKLQGLYRLFFMAQAFALTIQAADFYAIIKRMFFVFYIFISMKYKVFIKVETIYLQENAVTAHVSGN
ncbi:hypothetical protein C0W66_18685 [Photobacterium kishitanii]|nr:hypothetical protein AYY23_15875 [Photobacterium kishitanii]PSU21135.1 hypothetical protein CTM84_10090 [Photobacterium kishitanii]PSV14817.1 hypothetical protein C0W59_12915 [Photobacterium kishitanii]PSW47344.1 hypothetical protein C0W66_18685 [Photobacterium kishitanii]